MRLVVKPWVKKLSEVLYKNRKTIIECGKMGPRDVAGICPKMEMFIMPPSAAQ